MIMLSFAKRSCLLLLVMLFAGTQLFYTKGFRNSQWWNRPAGAGRQCGGKGHNQRKWIFTEINVIIPLEEAKILNFYKIA